MSEAEAKKINMEYPCTCLFCGKTFPAREMVFAKNESKSLSSSLRDKVFEDAMNQYKLVEGDVAVDPPYRRTFEWTEEDVETTEATEDGSFIPLTVNGRVKEDAKQNGRRKKDRFGLDDDEE